MREIVFYRTASGRLPVAEFINELSEREAKKLAAALRRVRVDDQLTADYFKKLSGTDDLWEVRFSERGSAYRILAFLDGRLVVVLLSAFVKKTTKTPTLQIRVAEQRKRDYLTRKAQNG